MPIVKHPEVNEFLDVPTCVVEVPCPHRFVAAGCPCRGARWDWLVRGTRRGFRYTQDTHYPRRDLWQSLKGGKVRSQDDARAEVEHLEGIIEGMTDDDYMEHLAQVQEAVQSQWEARRALRE